MVKILKSSLYFQYISKRNIVTLSNFFIIYVGLLVTGLPIKIFYFYTYLCLSLGKEIISFAQYKTTMTILKLRKANSVADFSLKKHFM